MGGTGLEPATPSVSSGTSRSKLIVLVYLMLAISLPSKQFKNDLKNRTSKNIA